MADALVWISIIIGLSVVTLFTLFANVIMRFRERRRTDGDETAGAAIERIDRAADAALDEINKTSRLALDELNEKYQAISFLYSLLEEKKKELAALAGMDSAEIARQAKNGGAEIPQAKNFRAPQKSKKAPAANITGSARYEQIKKLHDQGLGASEIAKRLDIGQGEVSLTLDLARRAGNE